MILRPCLHCPLKKTCPRKQVIQAQVSGLKLTTISFRCDDRNAQFPLGCRVEYEFNAWDYDEYYYEPLKGTVFKRDRSGKLVVWLDEPTPGKGSIIVKLWPDLVTKLDEPLVRLCPNCRCPEGKKNLENWSCETCDRGIRGEDIYSKPTKAELPF